MVTRSDSHYDLELSPLNSEGCRISIIRKSAEGEIVHTPEEYDFPDSLYQDHWENAEAYGVVSDAGEMMACCCLDCGDKIPFTQNIMRFTRWWNCRFIERYNIDSTGGIVYGM